jgi:hypothetical protein
MSEKLLAGADHLVSATARIITRRRFMRNAGAAAFGGALATATGATWPLKANAGIYPGNHVCGPSQYCPSNRCDGFHCHQTNRTSYRPYGGSYCSGTSGVTNCWTSPCVRGGKYMCCDCCMDDYPGPDVYGNPSGRCSGCPSSAAWYKCICHSKVASC